MKFDDNTEQIINFEPALQGEVYDPLRDLRFFNQVRLDADVGTLVWPNGADFDPYMLHEWPRLIQRLIAQTQAWARERV